jgi:hypothetical protein
MAFGKAFPLDPFPPIYAKTIPMSQNQIINRGKSKKACNFHAKQVFYYYEPKSCPL